MGVVVERPAPGPTWGRVRAGSKSCRKHKACQPTATAGHATYLPKVFPMMPAGLSQTGPEVFPPSTGRLIGGQTTQDEKMTKRKKISEQKKEDSNKFTAGIKG